MKPEFILKFSDIHVNNDSKAYITGFFRRWNLPRVDMDSPQAVLDEILFIMSMAAPNMDPGGLIRAFQSTVDLYQGLWPEELQEGQVGHYRDELYLLKHTLDFFSFAEKRIKDRLNDFDQLTTDFRARWNISSNLYGQAISRQKRHLAHILAHPEHHPVQFLKRKNIVRQSMNKRYKVPLP